MQRSNKPPDFCGNLNGFKHGNKMVTEDPFKHRLHLTKWDWLKTYFLTIFILPIRVLLFLIVSLLMNLVARIGLFNLSPAEIQEKPLTSYSSRFSQKSLIILARIACRICGFNFTIHGKIASVDEAPIIVAAPHSTFIDAPILALSGGKPTTCVFAEEYKKLPIIGKVIQIFQPIYVKRDDPYSRENTRREILKRTSLNNHPDASERWPHLFFAPEGMCSNRKALLPFKLGAFYPGKPVQPITIRYPNKIDTVTWTWDQPHGAMSVIWLTLAQPFTNVEIEFLPVYYPSTKEKEDPKFFASNVRKLMASHLDIPTYDTTFNEVKARYVNTNS